MIDMSVVVIIHYIVLSFFVTLFIYTYGDSIIDSIKDEIIKVAMRWKEENIYYGVIGVGLFPDKSLRYKKKQLRKNPDLLRENMYKWHHFLDERKKKVILRAYAYQYEELIFHIFSYKNSNNYYRECREQKRDVVISKIADYMKISKEEAINLYYILCDHELLFVYFKDRIIIGKILESGNTG